MDTQHRHELKTNELADWLTHAPEYLKKNASTIIGVLLIIIAIITWPIFSRMRVSSEIAKAATVTESIQNLERDLFGVTQAAEEGGEARRQATSALLVNANVLLEQADKIDNPDLAAMARIKAAQALRTELHYRAERIETGEFQSRIEQARGAYDKALASATTPTLKGMAKFGLGLCAEELGQRDAAAAIYREILDAPEFAATVVPLQAQQRLDNLKENLETFVFAPAPAEEVMTIDSIPGQTPPLLPEGILESDPTILPEDMLDEEPPTLPETLPEDAPTEEPEQ
ncbi:MAG: hypothetical protein GXY41_00280 [Phycisphaerae bacterium]|nr:hypothetical protein [Phycisphaerae bacterium]